MRSRLLTIPALTAALLLPVMAVAQQSGSGVTAPAGQSMSSQRGAFSNAAHASDIIGKKAYGPNGETVGNVNDLLIDSSGRVQAAVVDVGGFLGMGQHTVALDWTQLKIAPSSDRVTIGMTKEQLKSAPEYKKSAQANAPANNQQTGQMPGERSAPAQ
jgi:sporulation protein YlmC with PRC-barrel domain